MQTDTRMDFERFYEGHANAVYSYCLRRVGVEAAKDATADVFVVAWRRWGAVPEGDAAAGWLYGVARNVLRARQRPMRRRGRLVEKVAAQPEPSVVGPELQVVRLAEHEAVLAALGKLPEKDREIILLIEWEGRSREQVAEMMSVTRAAIDRRMARSHKNMARSLRVDPPGLPNSGVGVDERRGMTDVGGLVRSVNPVGAGQTLLTGDELDALLVLINERNTAPGVEELTTRVQPMQPRRRGWLVSAAVVVIVLGVLAPVVFFVGDTEPDVCTGPDIAATASATTMLEVPSPTAVPLAPTASTDPEVGTSVPATTLLQATTPPEVAGTWTRILGNDTVFGGVGTQIMWNVTVGGPGFVAVGWHGSDAAVWLSFDGIDWLRVPHDKSVFGRATMNAVTVGDPGLVAVGITESIPVEEGDFDHDGDAAVWTSVDGVTWTRVPHAAAVFGGADYQTMRSVAAGGPGLVAVGSDGLDDAESDAAVWTSVDGITWTRVQHDEAVFGASTMEAVTVGGPGLVAVGSDGHDDAAVWTSVDGITWSRVPHDESVFGGTSSHAMRSVTVGGPGLVAVGDTWSGDGTTTAVVWTSVDGVTWSRVAPDESVFGRDRTMHSVTAGGPGLVAVGETHVPSLAAVWVSDDGIIWVAVPHDSTVFGQANMYAVTATGSRLVAVGLDESSGSDAGVWTWDD